jgi:putative ABC transport system permease protein
VWNDLRSAVRLLRKSPGITLAVVATLALGLGLNAAIFSILNAFLIREPPYAEPDRIVRVTPVSESQAMDGRIAGTRLVKWRADTRAFEALAGYLPVSASLVHAGDAVRLTGASVSPALFDVLHSAPLAGRTFLPDEERSDGVVVLGHALWQQQFAGRRDVLGEVINLGGEPREVIGVMPLGFGFPSADTAFWIPLNPSARFVSLPDGRKAVTIVHAFAVGRLSESATFDQARAEAAAVLPDTREIRVTSLHEELARPLRVLLLAAQLAGVLILLIVCVNVANILLARGADRQRELAIRSAIGAPRARIMRQLLVEAGVLTAAGTALALVLAWWAAGASASLYPDHLPSFGTIVLDLPVLVATAALAGIVALAVGWLPAWRFSRADLVSGLRAGGEAGATPAVAARRTIGVLACVEIALALVLVTTALAVVRTFLVAVSAPAGYETGQIATADVTVGGRHHEAIGARQTFIDRMLHALDSDPLVERAAMATSLPLEAHKGYFHLGRGGEATGIRLFTNGLATRIQIVSDAYLDVLQIPVVRGRSFSPADGQGRLPVIVISNALAARDFPDADPVGQTMSFWGRDWHIIGVAGNVRDHPLGADSVPLVYVLYQQIGYDGHLWSQHLTTMSVAVRSRAAPAMVLPRLAQSIRDIDPDVAVHGVLTMEGRLYQAIGPVNVHGVLMSGLAMLALALAGTGIFGLLSWTVAQRTREIGIRVALGAERAALVGGVLRDGLVMALFGIGMGLPLAILATRVLQAFAHGLEPASPSVLLLAPVVVVLVVLTACAIPARRATRVDPIVALRAE